MTPNRMTASVLILVMIVSAFTAFTPLLADPSQDIRPQDKLEDTLLNKTTSSDTIEAMVSYNDDLIDFKMSQAVSFTESIAEIIEVYDDLSMVRIRIVGKELLRLAKSNMVSFIAPNEILHIEQMVESCSLTIATSEQYVDFADVVGARDLWEQGYNGSGVILAVLATGIDSSHPDLDNFDDNSSRSKLAAYASFVEVDSLPIDILGPGSYAASIAAGTGNASAGYYSGIAPGATLLAGKVTFGGILALPSWIVSGIEWASTNGADIILLPFNTFGAPNDAVAQAIAKAVNKGIFVVAAAGDDGPDYLTIMSPGGGLECFTVGAYDTQKDEVPAFSGRGPSLSLATKPDLVAPGVGIVGARLGGGLSGFGLGDVDLGGLGGIGNLLGGSIGEDIDDYYKVADTTAASAAIVAGAAAILMGAFDRATPIVIGNVLRDTATRLPYGANDVGAGLLNLKASFNYLRQRQEPIDPMARTTGSALLSFGFLAASGNNASSILMMSSFGTSTLVMDSRGSNMDIHMLMGTFSLKWNDMDPTSLMSFNVKRELHSVTLEGLTGLLGGLGGVGDLGDLGGQQIPDIGAGSDNKGYGRYVGVLSYEEELFVTLLVESYNFTENSTLPLTAYKITPFILNIGESPIDNVSLYLSYSLDLFGDGKDDHGRYSLSNHQLFAYGISDDYRDFFIGINSSRQMDAFEVGNASEISSHITNDNLTGSTNFDGEVGFGMKWDFGRIYPGNPVNVSIAMGFGENRTVLDASVEAIWTANPPSSYSSQGDFLIVQADIPRTAQAGETYRSQAIVMNIGVNPSDALSALAIIDDDNGTGTAFVRYFTFSEIKPFHIEILDAEWRPEDNTMHNVAWISTIGLESLNDILSDLTSLLGGITSLAISILDDFIQRDVFVVDPILSVSLFPKVLPFGPFDVRFPIDFGIYTISLASTVDLGNLTVTNVGNASDWGNATLNSAESIKGFYNFSIFLLVPPITVDGYHRCDYVLNTEFGWSGNVTLERTVEYPRAMILLDTSHGGGFGSLMGGGAFDLGDTGGFDIGGFGGGGGLPFPGFLLAQDMDDFGSMGLGDVSDLGSIMDLFDSIRLTTFSGLSIMENTMAERGIEILELPGSGINEAFSSLVSAVMLIAPTEELNSTHIQDYRDFSESGGKVIIFGDTEDRANLTGLNPLLEAYGYYMSGEHDEENTTEIIAGSLLGAGMDSMYLGGGTYIYNNQSRASVTLNGKPVVLVDDSAPELVLFGSSRIFMNDNIVKCNNSILLDNLIEYLLGNTLTCTTSLAENTTSYPVGKSVYLNLYVTDYYGAPVDDLFVAIAFVLPNGSQRFFIAGFVEDGLYSSQFLPSYWGDDGIIHGIFILLREEYAGTYAGISFELYAEPPTNGTTTPEAFLTMVQLALVTSIGIFGGMFTLLALNRYRRRKRMRIPEIDMELANDIDSTLNMFRATLSQVNELIGREDIDRIQKIETLRSLMETLEIAKKKFQEISDRIGGI